MALHISLLAGLRLALKFKSFVRGVKVLRPSGQYRFVPLSMKQFRISVVHNDTPNLSGYDR